MLCRNTRFTLCSSAALLLLAGCGGGGSQTSNSALPAISQAQQVRQAASSVRFTNWIADGRTGLPASFRGLLVGPPQKSPGWLSEDAKSGSAKVYVSDAELGEVLIYNAAKPTAPIGTITNGISEPLGTFVDASGNLYVANIGSNTVTVYPKGKTAPSMTYSSGLSGPIGVAVGSDGTVYVPEFETGAVVEYYKGKTKPSLTLAVPDAEGVALDAKNNLYVSFNDPSTGEGAVEEFAPKKKTGTNLGITVEFAGDVKLNKKGDLLLEDQDAQAVDFYKPKAKSPYGSISASGFDTYKEALNAAETELYIATVSDEVDIFDAVPSGKNVGAITSGLEEVTGVSLSPAAPL